MTRERDELGRPLPPGSSGVPGPVTRSDRTAAETVDEAQRWLDRGRPFAAHEVFEDAWKNCPASERALWQGLAQVAAASTHAMRGNARGVVAITGRAREALVGYATDQPYGIDIAALVAWTERAAAAAAADPGRIDRLAPLPRLLGP